MGCGFGSNTRATNPAARIRARNGSVQVSQPGSAMTRRGKIPAVALATLLESCGVCAAADGPPLDSLYGAYEVLGRGAGENGATYRGWVRLAIEGHEIEIDRCVAGHPSSGRGREVRLGADQLRAIEFRYEQRGVSFVATCTVTGDFDNLPRFSCYVTPADAPAIAVPGIETYFAIVWPVPLDYFACH